MIKLIVVGQELSIVTQKVVSGTHDYLTVSASFKGSDWTNLRKWVHFTMGEHAYIVPMTDDAIGEEMHLDLTEGTWEIYVHGNEVTDDEVTQRVTTNIEYLYVEAPHDGHPFPPLTPTFEEILANLIAEAKDVWTRLWIAAENGALGGPYYLPSVSEDGIISWTNNGGKDNPAPRLIRGPEGRPGDSGVYIGTTQPTDPNVNVWINPEGAIGKVISGYRQTGNHSPGTYDHLVLVFSDNSELDIPIYNGIDGDGSGDMAKSVYDPTNQATDVFGAIDDAIDGLAEVARTGSYEDLVDAPDVPTVDDALSLSSENPVQNKVIKQALDQKQNTLSIDVTPTQNSSNPVSSGGVYAALQGSGLTVDANLSATSENPVQNKVIKAALDQKQDKLTIDNVLSSTSANPVRNSVIKSALDQKQDKLTIDSAMSATSTNPVQNRAIVQYVSNNSGTGIIKVIRQYQGFTIDANAVYARYTITVPSYSGYTLTGVIGAYSSNPSGAIGGAGVLYEGNATAIELLVTRVDTSSKVSSIGGTIYYRLLYTKLATIPTS